MPIKLARLCRFARLAYRRMRQGVYLCHDVALLGDLSSSSRTSFLSRCMSTPCVLPAAKSSPPAISRRACI